MARGQYLDFEVFLRIVLGKRSTPWEETQCTIDLNATNGDGETVLDFAKYKMNEKQMNREIDAIEKVIKRDTQPTG